MCVCHLIIKDYLLTYLLNAVSSGVVRILGLREPKGGMGQRQEDQGRKTYLFWAPAVEEVVKLFCVVIFMCVVKEINEND